VVGDELARREQGQEPRREAMAGESEPAPPVGSAHGAGRPGDGGGRHHRTQTPNDADDEHEEDHDHLLSETA